MLIHAGRRQGRPRCPTAHFSMRCSMRVLHFVVALGLVLALAGGASAAKKGKKGKHPVKGVVESVEKSSGKDAGSITVKVTAKKMKGTAPAGAAVEKKI